MARLIDQIACALIVVVALTSVASQVQHAGANKLVRVALEKKISMQSGELKQPVTSYYANVAIGTPPKHFRLLIDINARELWMPHYLKLGIVFSRLNYKNGYCKKDSSTSVKEQGEEYKIDYKGCELTGKAYRDVFEFKNVTESVQPVRYEQRFLAISSASNDKFTQFDGIDGVLALNPWPISETGSDSTTVSLRRAKITSELRYALALDYDLTTRAGGELTMGGLNTGRHLGDIRYHTSVSQRAWELSLHSVMLGANLVGDCQIGARASVDGCTALLTTTSNDIYGPNKAIHSIHKLLGVIDPRSDDEFDASILHEIDCLKVASAPMLTFVIDGAYYVLPPTSYIRKKQEGLIFKTETCYVALLANGSTNKWELGTNFLTNYYTVFDQDKRQVGFGVRK